nr:hypothetical protein [Butyrivibrio sp.]
RVASTRPEERIEYLCDLSRDCFNLLERTVNGETESFIYDRNVVSMSKAGNSYYYLQDELGSPMYMTGTDGAAVSSYAFDDFGRSIDPFTGKIKDHRNKYSNGIAEPGNNHAYTREGNIIQPFAFTGYQEDEVSGLKFAQARFYDADTGRFQAEDRVKGFKNSPFTLNHYSYCFGNPVGFSDRNGNWPSWGDVWDAACDAWDATCEVVGDVCDAVCDATAEFVDETKKWVDALTPPSKEEHYNRNNNNISVPETEKEFLDGIGKDWTLLPDDKAACHYFTAGDGEIIHKYVSPDGTCEAIYDASGNLITADEDLGTYNYYPYNNDPNSFRANIGHFFNDILPWIKWGNTENDTTNEFERFMAFIPGFRDLERHTYQKRMQISETIGCLF